VCPVNECVWVCVLGGVYSYICMYMSVHVCIHVCTYMYVVCVCIHACVRVGSCVRLRVAAFRIRSCDLNSITGDSGLCPLWTRYSGDSKTDSWDDLKIRTSSYGEDQMAIRIQNHVISYECLFLCHFLIYRCQ